MPTGSRRNFYTYAKDSAGARQRTANSRDKQAIMLMGWIGYYAKSDLWICRDGRSLSNPGYLRMLEDGLLDFQQQHYTANGEEMIWQQDGAKIHTAHSVQQWCDDNLDGINTQWQNHSGKFPYQTLDRAQNVNLDNLWK